MNLTRNEIEVMDVFWGVGRPLSRAELLNLSVDKSWQSNSVHILLNSLLKKGALREAGFVRSGKTYGRTFEAALTCAEYYASSIQVTKNKPSLTGLLTALLQVYDPDDAELDQLAEVLNQRRARRQEGND
ncbi:MAG: BlaI/MecI/CopY family transcriptional regulator [Oscillospiraceae bacterium]